MICRVSSRPGRRRSTTRIRRFFFAGSTSTAPSLVARRHDHLGEHLGDLLGHGRA